MRGKLTRAGQPELSRAALARAAKAIRRRTQLRPTLAFVLGSGFQHVARVLEVECEIPYGRLPGFLEPSVGGHTGRLLIGRLGGTPVLVLSGRVHYYEGHSLHRVTWPVRVLAALGITDLLLTNAAGGIRNGLSPGDFMLLTDHINLMGDNPLRGAPPEPGRFVDLTRAYDPGLASLLKRAARQCRMPFRAGVYLAVSGPSYETPAEIRAFARLGADAVGMSTVPETIVARQLGIRVAAVSCITNLAAGRSRENLSHTEVLDTGRRVQEQAAALLAGFATLYGRSR